jgi:hypothetical protein
VVVKLSDNFTFTDNSISLFFLDFWFNERRYFICISYITLSVRIAVTSEMENMWKEAIVAYLNIPVFAWRS